jgi:hypothetical protein
LYIDVSGDVCSSAVNLKRTSGMAQVVEYLLGKYKALSPIPSTAKKKKKTRVMLET